MGRQQTLGKCIGELGSSVSDMCPLGKFFGGGKTADPPVQTKLEEAFGGKRKRTGKTEAKVEVKACEGADNQQDKGVLLTLQMSQSLTMFAATRSPSPAKDGEFEYQSSPYPRAARRTTRGR